MSDAMAQFEKRLESLERKHKELAAGYVARINPDGLITVEPRSRRTGLTARLLAMLVIGVVSFKVITLTLVGPVVYQSRVDALAVGTKFEQAAAWIMQADPLSQRVAQMLNSLF
ncbi:MAG: hypothetical protein PVI41_08685 [Roseobacter sp.]